MPASKFMAMAALVLSGFAAVFAGAVLLVSAGVLGGTSRLAGDFEARTEAFILANSEVLIESVQQLEARQQAAAADEL